MKVIFIIVCGCASSPPATATGFALTATPDHAVAGDAVTLDAVQTFSDGSTRPVTGSVTFAGAPTVTTVSDDPAASLLPDPGAQPTAIFVANAVRDTHDNVVFVLDAGTQPGGSIAISATFAGGTAAVTIPVAAGPQGDATRGATLYGATGANCANCHGATGHGSVADATGAFSIDGMTYAYPAPGLNSEDGNVASDPDWSAPLLAIAARSDMDNEGVTLRQPMPDWLETNNPKTDDSLTTADFADIYAFLKTQTQ